MSKQEFSRLDVLLRVQSGRLRVSDARVLIGLQRRQVFGCCAGSSRTAPRACAPSTEANPATIGSPLRFSTLALSRSKRGLIIQLLPCCSFNPEATSALPQMRNSCANPRVLPKNGISDTAM